MITNLNEYRKFMENVTDELVVNTLYKVYDRTKGGSIMYSQAKYLGKDDKGHKFELINKKEDNIVHLVDLNNYSCQETRDFTTKPTKK